MAHTLTIVEPIWPMLQNISKNLYQLFIIFKSKVPLYILCVFQIFFTEVTVHKGSVCDQPLLTHLFREHQFKAVIHAVSYSGNDVSLKSSIKSNIECLATLLEVLKDFKVNLLHVTTYVHFLSFPL